MTTTWSRTRTSHYICRQYINDIYSWSYIYLFCIHYNTFHALFYNKLFTTLDVHTLLQTIKVTILADQLTAQIVDSLIIITCNDYYLINRCSLIAIQLIITEER